MDRLRRHPICSLAGLGLAFILWSAVAAALTSPTRTANQPNRRRRHDVQLPETMAAVITPKV